MAVREDHGAMGRRVAKYCGVITFLIYGFLNWGGLVFHHHDDGPLRSTAQAKIFHAATVPFNCPICAWGKHNISTAAGSLALHFPVSILKKTAPKIQALFSLLGRTNLTARAPPSPGLS